MYKQNRQNGGPVLSPTKIVTTSPRSLCPVNEDSVLHQLESNGYSQSASLSPTSALSSSVGSVSDDSNGFILSELAEEDLDNNNSNIKEYRPRLGSGALKGLISSFKRSRNKSGDTQAASPASDSSTTTPLANGDIVPEKSNKSGFKSFFRPRSQSDAPASRNMLRHRHLSTGSSPTAKAAAAAAHADAINNNHAPVQRSRSTSWGAQEKLAMSKQMRATAGNQGNQATPMSQLISGGTPIPVNRKVERNVRYRSRSLATTHFPPPVKMMDLEWRPATATPSPPQSPGVSGSLDNRFTGKAFIWQRAMSVDESSRRQVKSSSNAKTRREQFIGRKWNTADMMETEFEDLVIGDTEVFKKFMRAHKCYDLIPVSSKLVVFDTKLSVKKAFYALVYNCVRAAPLWDNARQEFIGMLTISDFIYVLTKYYRTAGASITELEEHKISTWRTVLSDRYSGGFISVSPDDSLHAAVNILLRTKVHRLPIVDPLTGNALYILTHKRLLKFLYLFMKHLPQPAYMSQSIDDLHLGTLHNIATVTMDTKLIDALNMFVERRVSAFPVVNNLNQVENVYAKFDVINLAADKSYNDLDISIAQAIGMRRTPMEGVHSCQITDSLKAVIEKFVRAEVHRLFIVDEENRLDGIISLSDVLSYLVREDRHLSGSFSNLSCSAAAGDDKMDVFPPEPLEAV